ncbi:hypothetical protein FH972_024425 [Carpinus fangiana]|uniref:Serine/threonine-protein kinase RIO1 n=1 Tax=Carpinus fangiana TaxID=176857 RepID=A0A5N6KY04_9ROSI|nr:hypothetical protein FH972_024425 [Carpinus fangiana]
MSGSTGASNGIADAHVPPHVFIQNRGYEDLPTAQDIQQAQIRNPEDLSLEALELNNEEQDDDDDDDIFDEGDTVEDFDIASTNPVDYTKTYNRQRQLNDPNVPESQKPKTNSQKPKINVAAMIDDQILSLQKHAAKLKLDKLSGEGESGGGASGSKDKSERATSEQVLDPRTRMILLQMLNRNLVSEVNGVISTGKEANVYHATTTTDDGRTLQRAIKIYKTSILVFKDRAKYVTGEHRFRQGFNKSSNRAMVKVWAEKEMRNLKRLNAAGIPSPEVIHLRSHVLLMTFIGDKKGWSAPLLRDVQFEDADEASQWRELYLQVLGYMRTMYQICHLVHGDLSEYNMLYHKGKAYVIDVSQSVEHEHPRSFEFLRMDIKNVGDFFNRKGVETISEQAIFGFVTASSGTVEVDEMRTALEKLGEVSKTQNGEDQVDTEVFRNQYMPQNLDQVYDIERDAEKVGKGQVGDLVYQSLLATKTDQTSASSEPNPNKESADANDDEEEDESDSDDENDDDRFSDSDKQPRGKRFQDKNEKKEHKQKVKEEKREKRKTKMPKHEKKKLMNQSGRGKK